MADEQSKLDKLIAVGATPEELARVRAEDAHTWYGKPKTKVRPFTPEEIAARKDQADQLAAVRQRGQDIQKYAAEQGYKARLARMKRATQTQAWPPPPTSEQE